MGDVFKHYFNKENYRRDDSEHKYKRNSGSGLQSLKVFMNPIFKWMALNWIFRY